MTDTAGFRAGTDAALTAFRGSRNIKFGTDGWRGIIADDFTVANVRLVALAIIKHYIADGAGKEQAVVVGYDNRAQGETFARHVAEVAASLGVRAILSDKSCSSPMVSFSAKQLNTLGGIMVTASHNPPDYNGLKLKASYGGSASPELVQKVEVILEKLIATDAVPASGAGDESLIERHDLRGDFVKHLATVVDLAKIANANLRIVVDPMHGSGAGVLSKVLRDSGCGNVTEIRSERNPVFGGINPEPIPNNLKALAEAVVTHKADIGLALDGDADRLGAMDEDGNFVDSHRIFAVVLKHLFVTKGWTGGIVKTVSTTQLIDKLAAKYDLKLFETPIGFKYICDLMLQEDILIGGEESGGIGIKNHIPERDGILMSLMLLEAVAYSGKSIKQLVAELMDEHGTHEYNRVDVRLKPARMADVIGIVKGFDALTFADLDIAAISKKDGTKLTFTNGSWLLLRPSGTEPVVRVYSEAKSQDEVQRILAAGLALVNG